MFAFADKTNIAIAAKCTLLTRTGEPPSDVLDVVQIGTQLALEFTEMRV